VKPVRKRANWDSRSSQLGNQSPRYSKPRVATPTDDQRDAGRNGGCASCGAELNGDQRYCVECGMRHGPLPPAIATRVAAMLEWARAAAPPLSEAAAGASGDAAEEPGGGSARFMPTPRAAAVAVMGMLAFGVMIGSAISPLARSAGLTSILLEVAPPPPPSEAEEAPVTAEAPVAESSAPIAGEASSVPIAPVEGALPEEPTEPPELPQLPEEELLPPIKHVFLIVLGENGYEEAFGPSAPAPYLAKTLPEQGELLANYYAVTKGDLANQIALVSGQGPTVETAANCPNYADVSPGTLSATGQVEGSGCVYPAEAKTLAGQLVEKKLKWKAYVEDIGNGAAGGQPATCRHPALGSPDPAQAPQPGDAYETWRNPFVYFHSLIDTPECAERDVGLDLLAGDLKAAKKTPALSYIVPNACHDGGEVPCEEGQPFGPLQTEAFLQAVVPEIEASPAYKEGGLIAITSSQARQTGPTPDASSCCTDPAYPNLPAPPASEPVTGPVKPTGGGGRVGLLLISPFVAAGTVNTTGYYNHFSLLLSIEELFELEPLGYAAEPALAAFDSSVYNGEAAPVAEEPLPKPPKRRERRAIRNLARAPTP
jgi:phosphatidylinositol-3-phosphatase